MLHKIISQSLLQTTGINPLIEVLTPAIDVTATSLYWFMPYLAADFPEVTCDKKYFFLWSTDHDGGDGGVYWGKGNSLYLSDFEEIGLIVDGYQAETPFLYRNENNPRVIHLFYHTGVNDPGNTGQETRLLTCNGGLLDVVTWTDEGRPLGWVTGQDHSGYFKFWNNGTELKGVHYEKGAVLPTYNGKWVYSTSDDGLTWVRGAEADQYSNIDIDKKYGFSFGEFFKMFGQWWWLGTVATIAGAASEKYDYLVLSKANADFEATEQILIINTSEYISTWSVTIFGVTAHIYLHHDNDNALQYSQYDLAQLENYI